MARPQWLTLADPARRLVLLVRRCPTVLLHGAASARVAEAHVCQDAAARQGGQGPIEDEQTPFLSADDLDGQGRRGGVERNGAIKQEGLGAGNDRLEVIIREIVKRGQPW